MGALFLSGLLDEYRSHVRVHAATIGVLLHHVTHIMQSTVSGTCLQWLYTQQGYTGVHMNDFSINNAPLIIVLLFKGEWQSFLSSRGGRGPGVSQGRPDLHFGKCTLLPVGLPIVFSQYWL